MASRYLPEGAHYVPGTRQARVELAGGQTVSRAAAAKLASGKTHHQLTAGRDPGPAAGPTARGARGAETLHQPTAARAAARAAEPTPRRNWAAVGRAYREKGMLSPQTSVRDAWQRYKSMIAVQYKSASGDRHTIKQIQRSAQFRALLRRLNAPRDAKEFRAALATVYGGSADDYVNSDPVETFGGAGDGDEEAA